MIQRRKLAAALVAATFVIGATSASAEVAEGSGELELYVGYLMPDESPGIDGADDIIYGVRGGYNFSPRGGFQGSIGRYDDDVDVVCVTPPCPAIDVTQTMIDLSFLWHVNPAGRAVFNVYVGPGWTFADASLAGVSASDDSLTAHFGLGAKVGVTDAFYLRPDTRFRWYEDSGADNEWEASLGFGWTFGR